MHTGGADKVITTQLGIIAHRVCNMFAEEKDMVPFEKFIPMKQENKKEQISRSDRVVTNLVSIMRAKHNKT